MTKKKLRLKRLKKATWTKVDPHDINHKPKPDGLTHRPFAKLGERINAN